MPANRWVDIVAKANGYEAVNLGRGGTGYFAASDIDGCGLEFCANYLTMVESIDPSTDVVIVAGGQNDVVQFTANPQSVTDAIQATYTALRVALPDAEIIAVGPSTPGAISPEMGAFDQAVRTSAANAGARYVSMLAPPVLSPELLSDDGVHPNDAGHAAIAAQYLASIPPVV